MEKAPALGAGLFVGSTPTLSAIVERKRDEWTCTSA